MAEVLSAPAVAAPSIFEQIEQHHHEQVVFCHDEETGLRAIIGIHNTVLGPSLGGTRMWHYTTDADALHDVLRLSRGMTYKASISGLNLGGGKAVILGDAKTMKTPALLRRFGQFVDSLGGRYITAEDVGINTADMAQVRHETKHVTGLPAEMGGSGDPSPVTAYTTYLGMKAGAKTAFGSDSLAGKRVAVQGAGHVGIHLIERLLADGAQVFISDYYAERVAAITKQHPEVKAVGLDEIYDLDVDIYAPCALGATLNDDTIPRLKAAVVAGCANNQLADERLHGPQLVERGIYYAPDFLINAGGLINVYSELHGYNRDQAYAQAERIYDQTLDIFRYCAAQGTHPQQAAIQIAEERIAQARAAAAPTPVVL